MNGKKILRLVGTIFLFLALPAGVVLVQTAVRYFSSASGLPANLVIDMSTDYGVSPDAWRYLAQGGEDKGRMLAPIIPQIKALKPEYIRIDHVFDFYDNIQKLDETIGDITSSGAKPFIALSYMPPSISKSGDVTDYPSNWVDWENQVQKLIEHVSGRGELGINDVYYEVWNEPDLFGDYKIGGSKNYLDLYLHSAIGAGRASDTLPFKLGGPATTGYYKNWMTGLIDYVAKNNLRLDFLSWHKYSKDIDDYIDDVDAARSLLANYGMPDKELIISEMGPNGAVDPVYDNNFGAIHEIATSIVLQNEVDKTFTFEIKDGASSETKYWGRWGLYTNEKFGTPEEKPRAKAFKFLNSMAGGSKLNVFGQGSWIRAMAKKMDGNITRILVVNYDPKGTHEEMVPVKFASLPSQNFIFNRIDFLGQSSSLEVATASAEWETTQYFQPNSAAIFEVILK